MTFAEAGIINKSSVRFEVWVFSSIGGFEFKLISLWRDPEDVNWELLNCIESDSKEFHDTGIALSSRYISSPILPVSADDFVPTRRDRAGDSRRTTRFRCGSVDPRIHADMHDLRR